MTDLRDKIARALSTQTICDGEPFPTELHFRQADAVLAVLDLDKVRAEAWEKGFDACEDDIHHHSEQGWDAECVKAAENPYRKEEQ